MFFSDTVCSQGVVIFLADLFILCADEDVNDMVYAETLFNPINAGEYLLRRNCPIKLLPRFQANIASAP